MGCPTKPPPTLSGAACTLSGLADGGAALLLLFPAGLIDEAGGAKQLVLGVDDQLLQNNPRNIPRSDVAALAVGCIGLKEAMNRSFDVVAVPPASGAALANDPVVLLSGLASDCDYTINSQA